MTHIIMQPCISCQSGCAISCDIFFIYEMRIDHKKAGRSGRLIEESMPASPRFFYSWTGVILMRTRSLHRRPWRVRIVPEVQVRCGWSLPRKTPGWRPRCGSRAPPAISLPSGFWRFNVTATEVMVPALPCACGILYFHFLCLHKLPPFLLVRTC